MSGTIPFLTLRPCIAPGQHKFAVNFPPIGQYGPSVVVCERCGLTAKEIHQ